MGYGYNDIIGKQGIEKWGEQYLRGIDGTTGTTKEVNGKEITVMNDAEPVVPSIPLKYCSPHFSMPCLPIMSL